LPNRAQLVILPANIELKTRSGRKKNWIDGSFNQIKRGVIRVNSKALALGLGLDDRLLDQNHALQDKENET
jgi:hypothetical protein